MKNTILLGLALAISPYSTTLSAMDIAAFPGANNSVEIRVRPDAPVQGVFSSIVFTLRWDAGSHATLEAPQQLFPASAYLPIQPSGEVITSGGYHYQVYAGFGMAPISEFGTQLNPGEEVVITNIPVHGHATFEVINDDWTGELHNNGDYYVSVNGLDRTGIIYGNATAVDEMDSGYTLTLQPNPTTGPVDMAFTAISEGPFRIELVNALGQVLLSETINTNSPTFRKHLDIGAEAKGIYQVLVTNGSKVTVHKVVLH